MLTRDELLRQLYRLDELDEKKTRHKIAKRLRACGAELRALCVPTSAEDTLGDIESATYFSESDAKTIQEHLADLIEPELEATLGEMEKC